MWRSRAFICAKLGGESLLLLLGLAFTSFAQQESWISEDIGAPSPAGSSSYNATTDTFTVMGSGADIWGTSDQFQFVHRTLPGNGVIVARVGSVQNVDPWSKAGVMLRATTAVGSRHAMVVVTPGNGVAFQRRLSTNGGSVTTTVGGVTAPVWVKLELRTDTVIASYSTDGANWMVLGTEQFLIPASVEAGLAMTSHKAGSLCTATFTGVSLTSSSSKLPPSPWLDADMSGVPTPGSSFYENGIFTVYGSGRDIWGVTDRFHYVYQPFTGDGQITARVTSQQATDPIAKTGLMLRETLSTGSKNVMAYVTPGIGTALQYRTATGGSTTYTGPNTITAPYWLRLERLGSLVRASQSADGAQWVSLGEVNLPMSQQIYAGIPVTSGLSGAGLGRATVDNLTVSPQPLHPLPQPWQQNDVGNVAAAGSGEYDGGKFTIYGSGGDIWNNADAFHFTSQTNTGDGVIIARVNSVQNVDSWSKAGVMLRDSTNANSRHAMVVVTPGNGVSFQRRTATGGSSSNTTILGVTAPVWVKLEHYGNYVGAFYSTDGATWKYIGYDAMSFAPNTQIGLAVTSHNNGPLCKAEFDNVSVSTDMGVHGLRGSYYKDASLTTLGLTRVDPSVNFNWGTAYADPSVPTDVFSVRWQGQIKPRYSEAYTFFTRADDGVRLWINGQIVINRWAAVQATTENSGTITLEAGKRYDIKLEYYDAGYTANVRLDWASTSQPREIAPSQCLYPLDPNDTDYDGMADAWEQQIVNANATDGIASVADVLPDGDFDGDGLTNFQEYQQGTSPTDFYNGQLPNITVLSGNNQRAESGALVASPVILKVTNGAGETLANAPLQFTAATSGAGLSAVTAGTLQTTLSLRTGADGTASVYPAPSGEKGSTSTFEAVVASGGQATGTGFAATVQSGKATPMITGGAYHTLALRSDGTVWAWGSNSEGQLGYGTTTNSQKPVKVGSDLDGNTFKDVVAIAGGAYHSMALTQDGKVWTWGANFRGELGDGAEMGQDADLAPTRLKPGRVSGLNETADNPVIAIAAGSYYSLALKKDGTVWEWGTGLGQGSSDHLMATQVKFADGTSLSDIEAISAEGYHAVAIRKSDHTIWAWGQNASGELGNGTTITTATPVQVTMNGVAFAGATKVLAGSGYTLALKGNEGTVWAWGANYSGILGDGTDHNASQPVQVLGFDPQNPAADIATGVYHSMALCGDGRVWTWGENVYGELGNGSITPFGEPASSIPRPLPVSGITGNVAAIGAGRTRSFVIDQSGRIWAWGLNAYGVLGQEVPPDQTLPAILTTAQDGTEIKDVKAVACLGNSASLALKTNGSVWACGYNGSGGLGDGSYRDASQLVQVSTLQNITQIAAGYQSALALDGNGAIWQWGEIQNDPYVSANAPFRVKNATGTMLSGFQGIAISQTHALAIDANHQVWAWGDNIYGQLGTGTTATYAGAVQVYADSQTPLGDVTEVATGWSFSLARKTDGTVWAWGSNVYKSLGSGSTTYNPVYRPVKVALNANAVSISAGEHHALALDDQGRVWAWGDNTYGQLGNATTAASSNTPFQVTGFGGGQVEAVYAFNLCSMVVMKEDHSVWYWGTRPDAGMIGNPTVNPQKITGWDGVKALGANARFILRTDGSVASWGSNAAGELGIGGVRTTSIPLPINGFNAQVDSPVASITAPTGPTTATLGLPVNFQASLNGVGQIGKIDFYNEGEWIGSSTTGSFFWQPPTWGTYHIRAIATNTDGLTFSYSNSVELTVPYNPNWNSSSGSGGDPNADSDSDGVTDAQENTAGTDPNQKDNPALNLNVNVILK
jgi:alpha-tubulin suppressor-like RCC1 family protein/regulation of enolase protein 1 (concanavalin A-like superfamily)